METILNKSDKPHSYEFGKAGSRHKVYYNDVSELMEHLAKLKNAKLIEE